MKSNKVYSPHFWLGFISPIGIFIDPTSPAVLATSQIAERGLAVPISLIALPAVFIFTVFSFPKKITAPIAPVIFLLAAFFIVTFSIMASQSLGGTYSVIPYFIQWNLLFFWFIYFTAASHKGVLSYYTHGFTFGAFFNVIFYFLSGTLEIALYGSLQDLGRMSQNLIFIGQYQILVYVPTTIAYSILVVNALWITQSISLSPFRLIALNIAGLITLVYTGAREGLLVYILGIFLCYALISKLKSLTVIVFIAIIISVAIANLEFLIEAADRNEIRMIGKLANLFEDGRALSGRNDMISDVLTIIHQSVMFGTALEPPNDFGKSLGVSAPSAHNMYVDAVLWTGAFGGAIYITLAIYLLAICLINIAMGFGQNRGNSIIVLFSAITVLIILVSNNINVPMRQPVTAPIFAFILVLSIQGRRAILTNNKKNYD